MDPGDQILSLSDISTWKVEALRDFLSQRGLATKGSKDELIALCFASQKLGIHKLPSALDVQKQNKIDYEKILTIDGTIIKDPLTIYDGWKDEKTALSQWPPVFCSDIVKFFMSSSDPSTTQKYLNEYKLGKAYQYFSSTWLREIFYQLVTDDLCLLRAKCTPSQRLNNCDHSVWVCVEQTTGDIKSAYCSCSAGLGQTCNHIAGVLFRVEAANKMGITSCTSVPCSWNIPDMGKKVVQPLQVKDMQLTKTKHDKKSGKRRPPLINTTKADFEPVQSDPGVSHLLPLTNLLRKEIPTACIFKGLDMPLENPQALNSVTVSFDTSKYNMDSIVANFKATHQFQAGEDHFIDFMPRVTSTEIGRIEEQTRGQSANEEWRALRKGRITASNFYSVHTKMNTLQKDPTANITSLCNTLLGTSRKSIDHVRSIKHGRETEPEAKKDFVKSFSLKHQNAEFRECGLIMSQDYPFLSASPDMLVSCSCCGEGLLEVKCPLIMKCKICTNFCVCSLPKYLEFTEGNIMLKKNSAYYGQIQGQLAISEKKWCEFFVYTLNGNFCQRIFLDKQFYQPVLSNLVLFFEKYLVPRLLSSSIATEGKNMTAEPMDIQPSNVNDQVGVCFCPVCQNIVLEEKNVLTLKDRSVCCDSCNKWFHYSCAKVTQFQLNQMTNGWYCSTCTYDKC